MGLISKLGLKEKRGKAKAQEKYIDGNVRYVSASTEKSGISEKTIKATSSIVEKKDTVSIAVIGEGSVAFAQVQDEEFAPSSNVSVLENSNRLSLEERFLIASIIRLNRWRYNYGRNVGGRIDEIDFDMDRFKQLALKIKEQEILKEVKDEMFSFTKSEYLNLCSKIKGKTIGELFKIKTFSGKIEELENGEIPLVSASEFNNGVIGYTNKPKSEIEIIKAPVITVAKDGRPGVSRVQTQDFSLANSHAVALVSIVDFSINELFIIASLIENQSWRFSYGRAAGKERLGSLIIYP